MYFLLIFLILYAVSVILGRFIKIPSIASDIIIILLIFTISFWGGTEITGSEILYLIFTSLFASVLIVIVTYFLGLFFIVKGKSEWEKISWKAQLKYVLPLVLGLGLGIFLKIIPPAIFSVTIDYELYALGIIIGLQIGKDLKLEVLKRVSGLAIFSIFIDIIGAVITASLLTPFYPFKAILLVTLGSGWYSYTGPFVAKYYGPVMGVFAFLVNFLREQLTFLLIPLFFRVRASPIGAIAVGGATSMDVTLPLYVDLLGSEYAVVALINGLILTLLIPIILPIVMLL